MADGGGDRDGDRDYIPRPTLGHRHILVGEDGESPPPSKFPKLGAPGTCSVRAVDQSEAVAASDNKIGARVDSGDPMMDYETFIGLDMKLASGDGQSFYNILDAPIPTQGGGENTSSQHSTLGEPYLVIPPHYRIPKLGAPSTSSIDAECQSEAMATSDHKIGARMAMDMTHFEISEVVDEMNRSKSNSIISKEEIEHLCERMEDMAALIRYRITPSAPLTSSSRKTTQDEDKTPPTRIDDILEQFADLKGSMSKLDSQLKPFWHKYPIEEEYVVPEKKDPKERARQAMKEEQIIFNKHLNDVNNSVRHFGYRTLVSPMRYTHYTPRQLPPIFTCEITLQIISFKITKINLDLEWPLLQWPLHVYGVVAARDIVDRRRNVLFHREDDNCQEINSDDNSLCLTGPSRAISADSPVEFEVQLNLKGPANSEDSVLIHSKGHFRNYYADNGLHTVTIANSLCRTELSLQKLYRGSVQATFLRVGIVKGSQSPFRFGGRVACSSPPQKDVVRGSEGPATPTEVVLLDSRDCDGGKMPIGEEDGYLDLSRHVVAVELQTVSEDSKELEKTLKVVLEAYSPGGSVQDHVMVRPQYCGISKHKLDFNGSKVKITIAWSPIVSSFTARTVVL